ncbi:hypothetical protein NDI85_08875 [Halomicroarcula sp. S1AR25-4]|uniref:hypothetical protein n=1 Tax=Haloarcula sp. S1AR25-4 TaxID=2950538 RepID=UPI0028749E2C|nr:hypothetical protein [Halomicroarcula sp. S1AR25-4]MDS0277908.1 hypothetical protein [Halomicroarcula sp. S1AR25-4]
MTVRQTFRIAEFDLPQDELPTPEELAENINDEFSQRNEEEDPVSGETLDYLEKGRNAHYEMNRDSYNFCYFRYVTDTPESFRIRNDDNEEVEQNETVLETASVIYFDTGEFAFQTRQDIAEAWIPAFIAKIADMDVDNDFFTRKFFESDKMRSVYQNADTISKIAFNHPGDSENISGNGLGDDIGDLAELCEGLTFSTGQGDGNLQGNSVIDAAVDALEVKQLNTKRGDENMITVKNSGRLTISWNESEWNQDELARNRAQTIRSKILPFI